MRTATGSRSRVRAVAGIAAYQQALAAEELSLRQKLLGGRASMFELALQRTMVDILRFEIQFPKSVLVWERMGPDPKFGFTGPQRWVQAVLQKAVERINPQFMPSEQLARKRMDYFDLRVDMMGWGRVKTQLIEDKQRGIQYLILGADPLVPRIMDLLGKELLSWFDRQPNTKELATDPPKVGLVKMLTERPD